MLRPGDASPPRDQSTVLVRGRAINDDGNEVYLLQRIGRSWNSYFSPAPDNYQGDPRWFSVVTGPRIGAAFGFTFIDAFWMSAPTAETANRVSAQLNEVLPTQSKIAIGFYETGTQPQDGKAYLQQLRDHGLLPIAGGGHYAVHDISYHTGAILMPSVAVRAAKRRADVALRFYEYALTLHGEDPWHTRMLGRIAQQHLEQVVSQLDYAMGNITFVLAADKHRLREMDYEAYDLRSTVIDYLQGKGSSPKEDLRLSIEKMLNVETLHWMIEDNRPGRASWESEKESIYKLTLPFLKSLKMPHLRNERITTESFVNEVRQRIVDYEAALSTATP